jgi:hypothetical protein
LIVIVNPGRDKLWNDTMRLFLFLCAFYMVTLARAQNPPTKVPRDTVYVRSTSGHKFLTRHMTSEMLYRNTLPRSFGEPLQSTKHPSFVVGAMSEEPFRIPPRSYKDLPETHSIKSNALEEMSHNLWGLNPLSAEYALRRGWYTDDPRKRWRCWP